MSQQSDVLTLNSFSLNRNNLRQLLIAGRTAFIKDPQVAGSIQSMGWIADHKIEVFALKNTIGLAVLTIWLVACASNSPDQLAETVDDLAEDGKVCTYETGGRLGSKMRRVCRTIDSS